MLQLLPASCWLCSPRWRCLAANNPSFNTAVACYYQYLWSKRAAAIPTKEVVLPGQLGVHEAIFGYLADLAASYGESSIVASLVVHQYQHRNWLMVHYSDCRQSSFFLPEQHHLHLLWRIHYL